MLCHPDLVHVVFQGAALICLFPSESPFNQLCASLAVSMETAWDPISASAILVSLGKPAIKVSYRPKLAATFVTLTVMLFCHLT